MVKVISIFILWCCYGMLEGWREAIFFHRVEVDKTAGKLLHSWWTVQRALVLGIIVITNFQWWVISLPLVFIWFHDGQYYTTRNKYNKQIYNKKWFAQSTTSTAFLTKFETPVVRTILFVIGVGILITYLII